MARCLNWWIMSDQLPSNQAQISPEILLASIYEIIAVKHCSGYNHRESGQSASATVANWILYFNLSEVYKQMLWIHLTPWATIKCLGANEHHVVVPKHWLCLGRNEPGRNLICFGSSDYDNKWENILKIDL